jgi:hypothetical protein
VPLQQDQVEGRRRTALLVLMGAVIFLLLVACANVPNLLLAQVAGRRQELAVRVALGRGPRAAAGADDRQSLLLTLAGGLLGVGLAHGGGGRAGAVPSRARCRRPATWAWTGARCCSAWASCLVASTAFGVLAALRATDRRHELQDDLKEGARAQAGTIAGAGGCARRWWPGRSASPSPCWRGRPAGAELLRVLRTDPGFRPEQVMVMKLGAAGGGRTTAASRRARADQQLLARLGALAGVVEVGAANSFPLDRSPANGNLPDRQRPGAGGHAGRLQGHAAGGGPHGFADYRVGPARGTSARWAFPSCAGALFDPRDAAGAPQWR